MSDDKLDKVLENQTLMLQVQTKQGVYIEQNTKDLSEHIRRTNLLEEKLNKVEEKLSDKIDKIDDDVKAVKIGYKVVIKLFVGTGAVIGLIKLIYEVLKIYGQ